MAVKETGKISPKKVELPATHWEAFAYAQSQFPPIPKDSEAVVKGKTKDGRFFEYTYRYASLPAILNAVLPILNRYGFALWQPFTENSELKTVLAWKDGNCFESTLIIAQSDRMTPQDYGKLITYMRRYAVVSLLGLAPDEDADAAGVPAPEPVQQPVAPEPTINEQGKSAVIRAMAETFVTVHKDLVKEFLIDVRTFAEARDRMIDTIVSMGPMWHEKWDEFTHFPEEARAELFSFVKNRMSDELDLRQEKKGKAPEEPLEEA